MDSHFFTRIFHFHRKLPFRNLLLRPLIIISLRPLIIISNFSTSAAANKFYRKSFFSHIFQECSKRKARKPGGQAHARMIVSGFRPTVFDANCLLHMYVKSSRLDCASKVFDRMPERNCVSWNKMIFGYSGSGKLESAQSFFDLMPVRDVISWNSMILGYLQNGNCLKSIELFLMMGRDVVVYDENTFSTVLKAIATLEDYVLGVQVHGAVLKFGFECEVVSGTAILDMYAKCGRLLDAWKVFNLLPTHDLLSYNALIAGYGSCEHGFEIMQLFQLLLRSDLGIDDTSLSATLSACAVSKGLLMGTQIHGLAIKTPFYDNVYVATAILNMYGKCGALPEACRIFEAMEKSVVSWNSMVCAYADHGYGDEALQVFEKMLLEKVKPDHTTFAVVLCACAHSGLVDEALHYLKVMKTECGLEPQIEHYTSTIDALGRSGRTIDALKLIQDIPLKANDSIWKSVLSNCKMHGNVEVAEIAAKSLLKLDPQDSSAYVLLSNMYAEAGMWDEASKIRRLMRSRGLKKEAGCSWIEVQGEVHTFVAGDKGHPQFDEMYEKLYMLMAEIKKSCLATFTKLSKASVV